MRQMKCLWSVILLGISFCACTSTTTESQLATIAVDMDNAKELKTSELFESVEYIPLEINDTFLLGEVKDMKVSGGKAYFSFGGMFLPKVIQVYDVETGKGLVNLSKSGQGPGEYSSISDFIVTSEKREVEVLNGNTIHTYDVNGNSIQSVEFPSNADAFMKERDGSYWLFNNHGFDDLSKQKIIRYDVEKQSLLEEYFPIDEHLMKYFNFFGLNVFQQNALNSFCYVAPIDTLYSYRAEEGLKPFRKLDFGKNHPPKSFFEENHADVKVFTERAQRHNYIYTLSGYDVSDKDDVILGFFVNKKYYWAFAPNGQKAVHVGQSLTDDYHSTASVKVHNYYAMAGDTFYFLLNPEDFMAMAEEEKAGSTLLKDLMEKHEIVEDSNPILVKCKLK